MFWDQGKGMIEFLFGQELKDWAAKEAEDCFAGTAAADAIRQKVAERIEHAYSRGVVDSREYGSQLLYSGGRAHRLRVVEQMVREAEAEGHAAQANKLKSYQKMLLEGRSLEEIVQALETA